jgi:hypothetical protein
MIEMKKILEAEKKIIWTARCQKAISGIYIHKEVKSWDHTSWFIIWQF